MKILFINTSDSSGGAAALAWNLSCGISKKGHTSEFLVGYKYRANPKVHTVESKYTYLIPEKYRNSIKDKLRYLRTLTASNDIDFGIGQEVLLQDYFREADIIHCHNLQGSFFKLETLALMSSQKPIVWTMHDMWPITAHCGNCYDCKNYNKGKHYTRGFNRHGADMLWDNSHYLWSKKQKIYKKCQNLTIVTPSIWLKSKLRSSILSHIPAKTIPNGVDTKLFSLGDKQKARRLMGLPINKKIILYVGQWGTMDKKKGADFFLWLADEFESRSDTIFVCIGGSNKYIVNKNIYYFPARTRQQMAMFYQSADVLLFPSLAENFPLTTLEAMAAGLPIAAFDVGGISEQIENHKNGVVCKYGSKDDLKRSIEFLLGLKESAISEMSNKNREKVVKLYSVEKMSESYIKLYEKLL